MADETSEDDRPEFLAELKDMYGYPVTLKDDGGYEVMIRIGSGIHNQDAYARLPEAEVRTVRDTLTAWLDKERGQP